MIDEELVTRCPDCGTSFRVTSAQLTVAGGAVRCGACLQIFSATEHLVVQQEWPEETEETEEARDLQETEQTEPEEQTEDTTPYLDEAVIPSVKGLTAEDWAEIESDEAWEDAGPDQAEFLSDEPDIGLGAGDLLDDSVEASWQLDIDSPAGAEVNVDVDAVAQVEDSLSLAQDRRDTSNLAWLALSIVMLVGLAGQVAWMELATLSQRAELRPWYEKTCNLLGCEIPVYADPSAIRTGDLIVRSHPGVADALAIDATVANLAPFRQAFPDLELRFSAMDGRPMAARVFTPDDYLAGELTGLRYLPARTEVHISLEIIDPGKEAVNYSLRVW